MITSAIDFILKIGCWNLYDNITKLVLHPNQKKHPFRNNENDENDDDEHSEHSDNENDEKVTTYIYYYYYYYRSMLMNNNFIYIYITIITDSCPGWIMEIYL